MARPEIVRAPWTPEQVWNLLAWQVRGYWHPFTCGGEACRADLLPTVRGWICPLCDYTQDWAHDFQTKPAPPETVLLHQRLHRGAEVTRLVREGQIKVLEEVQKEGNKCCLECVGDAVHARIAALRQEG